MDDGKTWRDEATDNATPHAEMDDWHKVSAIESPEHRENDRL